jgi:hypothetical protein
MCDLRYAIFGPGLLALHNINIFHGKLLLAALYFGGVANPGFTPGAIIIAPLRGLRFICGLPTNCFCSLFFGWKLLPVG